MPSMLAFYPDLQHRDDEPGPVLLLQEPSPKERMKRPEQCRNAREKVTQRRNADHFFEASEMMDGDEFVVICQRVRGPIRKTR